MLLPIRNGPGHPGRSHDTPFARSDTQHGRRVFGPRKCERCLYLFYEDGKSNFASCKDLYSYNIEQAAGHGGHNIITVVMNEKGVDLNGALHWVSEYHGQILSQFQAQYHTLPSWGTTIDSKVKTYVERLAHFIRGIDCWAFETERYFGTKGLEVQSKRVVNLLPKVVAVTPMMAPRREFDI